MDDPESRKADAPQSPKRQWAKFLLVVVLPLLLFAGLVKYATLRAGATERAMHEAVRSRNLSEVRWLLRIRPSLANAMGTADAIAGWTRTPSVARLSLSFLRHDRSVLFSAVENDDTDMIALLVSNGANLKAKDLEGRSLLSAAVAANCPKAAEVLLRMGLPITADDIIGAARSSDAKCLEVLLQHGADPNARNLSTMGTTALMFAALEGRADCVKLLLTHGADPNIKDADGSTALSYAAFRGRLTAMRILLDAGADPNADPHTLSKAQAYRSDKLVELLVAHGAK